MKIWTIRKLMGGGAKQVPAKGKCQKNSWEKLGKQKVPTSPPSPWHVLCTHHNHVSHTMVHVTHFTTTGMCQHTTITCHTVVHVTHHSYVSHTSHVSHTLPPMYTPQSCRTLWFISHSSPTQLCVTHCGLCHTLNHLTHCASCHTLHQLRHASHTTDMCHTLQ